MSPEVKVQSSTTGPPGQSPEQHFKITGSLNFLGCNSVHMILSPLILYRALIKWDFKTKKTYFTDSCGKTKEQ